MTGGGLLVPCRVDDDLGVYFAPVGGSSFEAPRFEDVIAAYFADGVRVVRVPADEVGGGVAPAGLIFHVGRCGSTLLCNLLASAGGWVAVKEPEFINRLLLRRERSGELIARLLRCVAEGVRIGADGGERACVVKLTSWNAILADVFVPALAGVPIVVVTRDPWAVVASYLHEPPAWWRGDDDAALARVCAEEWSRVVGSALRLPGEVLLVDYAALVGDPVGVLSRVLRHFGDARGAMDEPAVRAAMGRYSKGVERFDAPGRHRRDGLDARVREMVTEVTASSWRALGERT